MMYHDLCTSHRRASACVLKNVIINNDTTMEPDTDQKKGPPNVGIEPTTTRLRVVRSTD